MVKSDIADLKNEEFNNCDSSTILAGAFISHFIDNFTSQSNEKLTNIIENLGEDELFEDPDFPAVPNSLFYRYLSNVIFLSD